MGDPGLQSKFVEMQQAEAFDLAHKISEPLISDEERSLRMNLARIQSEMSNPNLNPLRREALFKALKETYWKLRNA